MANTNFNQATLDAVEAVITYALSKPKEAVKGRIDLDNGGSIEYRSFDELVDMRNNIKKIIDSEADIDLDASKKTPFRPFVLTTYPRGNL